MRVLLPARQIHLRLQDHYPDGSAPMNQHRRTAERRRRDQAMLAVVPLLLCVVIAVLASSRTGVVEVGDTLWGDASGNGVQDQGEAGIPGTELELFIGAPYSRSSADGAPTSLYLLEEPCPSNQLGGCGLFEFRACRRVTWNSR